MRCYNTRQIFPLSFPYPIRYHTLMMDQPTTGSPHTQIILDRLRFAAQTRIPPAVLASATLYQYEDIISRNLVLALEAELLAEKLVSEVITVPLARRTPATWLDHLKREVWYTDLAHDRIMTKIARRWPIRYREVEDSVSVRFERYAKFPQATIRLPELGRPVIFERWGEPEWNINE